MGATFSNEQQMSLEMLSLLPPGFSTLNLHHNTVGGFAVFEDFAVGRRLLIMVIVVVSCLRLYYM